MMLIDMIFECVGIYNYMLSFGRHSAVINFLLSFTVYFLCLYSLLIYILYFHLVPNHLVNPEPQPFLKQFIFSALSWAVDSPLSSKNDFD